MPEKFSLSTAGMDPTEATAMWRDVFCANVMHADPRFLEPESFSVDFELLAGEQMSLLRANMASIEHSRGPAQLACDGDRRLSLLFVPRGHMQLATGERRIAFRTSTVALSPHDEAHVATWSVPTMVKTIEFTADLLERVGAPVDRTFTLVSRRDPRIMMIERQLDLLWSLDDLTRSINLPRASDYLALIVSDILSRPITTESGLAIDLDRHHAIAALIARQFADPEFGLAEAARQLNLSPRVIAGILAGTGRTFNRTLMDARLAAVADRIASGKERIADCALACGFSDISYFNREFRSAFGMPPRAYRAAHWKI